MKDEIPSVRKLLSQQQEPAWMLKRRVMSAGRSAYVPWRNRNDRDTEFKEKRYCYLAGLVLDAALEINPDIRPLYIDCVTALGRDGLRQYRDELLFLTPDKMLSTHQDLAAWAETASDEELDQKAKELVGNADSFYQKYADHPDFIYYKECVSKLITKAFNYLEWETPRITGDNSPFLTWAIGARSAADSQNVTFVQLDQKRMTDRHWVMQDKTGDLTNRADKRVRKEMTETARTWHYHISHEDPLYEVAKLWYVAVVLKNNLTAAIGLHEYHGIPLAHFTYTGTASNALENFTLAMSPKNPVW